MTFDIEQRVSASRRRMAGTAGVAAFVLVMVVGVVVLLLARGGTGPTGTAQKPGGGASLAAVSAPGVSSDPGTQGAPAAATDSTGVGAQPQGAATDDAAAGGAMWVGGDDRNSQVAAVDGAVPLPGSGGSAPIDPAAAEVPPGVSPDPSGGGFVPPARRITLPSGAEQIDEYPVKFPQTPEGAAAASVAMTRYSATLDYLTASQVMRLYVSGEHGAEADAAAKAVVEAARQRLGIPAAGDPPVDASLVALPIGVQWVAESADRVRVSVLSVAEYRFGERLEREMVSVNSYLAWDGSDWKFVPAPEGGLGGPGQAEIGTKAFNDNGWSAIAEEGP